MPQVVQCRACAKRFNAPDALAGMNVLCPACKSPIISPGPTAGAPPHTATGAPPNVKSPASAGPVLAASGPIAIECPHCAKRFKGDAKLIGRQVACTACKEAFTVRAAVPQSATQTSTSTARTQPNSSLLHGPIAAAVGSTPSASGFPSKTALAERTPASRDLKKGIELQMFKSTGQKNKTRYRLK